MFKSSLLFIILSLYACHLQGQNPLVSKINTTAKHFIQTLTPEEQKVSLFPSSDPDRFNWSNEPENMHPRKGLMLSSMTNAQKRILHQLLQTVLSEQGYLKAMNVIRLDEWLKYHYYKAPDSKYYGDSLYRLALFGTPDKDKLWGWRFEGHHLSINVTLDHDKISITPFFLGTHPAIMPEGPLTGMENLFSETQLAHQLIQSLSPQQLQKAVTSNTEPKQADILIRTGKESELKTVTGIAVNTLNPEQQQLVHKLINSYIDNLTPSLAKRYSAMVGQKVWPRLHFIWMGPIKEGDPAYYRLQSPEGFVIEYCSRLHDANHIHTLWQFIPENFGGKTKP